MLTLESIFNSADWYKALTIVERARLLNGSLESQPIDPELVQQRLQRWQAQRPFSEVEQFNQKLQADGLDMTAFRHLLGMPIECVKQAAEGNLNWLHQIQAAYANFEPSQYVLFSQVPADQSNVLLLVWIEPLLQQGIKRVRQGVQHLINHFAQAPFTALAVEQMTFSQLPRRLLPMISRTLVLEMHVARLQGCLQGGTAGERYQNFIRRLQERDFALLLLREYPVLAREIVTCIDLWVNYSLEFLEHLCEDWQLLERSFGSDGLGVLEEINGGQGDAHNFGRSVIIATFSSGTRVVYKPRPLAVDVHFQELLAWLNEKGFQPQFRILTALDRGSYGWSEFVQVHGCKTDRQMERFYERQGGYLALLYALEAVDFHYENLISSGEHPVLVDLESLFHPHLEALEQNNSDFNPDARNQITYSVLRVGLLPQRTWKGDDNQGVDFSGFGAKSGQLTPIKVLNWESQGSDDMRFTRKRVPIPGGQNRPALNGCEVNVLEYVDFILKGFSTLYHLLLREQEILLAENGPIARFAEDEVRVIVRPTMVYGLLLQESYHPDFLRDAVERDCHFDHLWVAVERRPYLKHLIPHEYNAFQRGDIPLFTTRPDSCSLRTCNHFEIPDLLDGASLEHVRAHIQYLNEQDLERQNWFISASLTTLAMGTGQAHWPSYPFIPRRSSASNSEFLEKAVAVGDRIEMLALQKNSENDAIWLGVTLLDEQNWALLPLGIDLYNGLPGIAVFLGQLGALTEKQKYSDLAQWIVNTVIRQYHHAQTTIKSVGGYNGWGGLIYLFTYLGTLWNDKTLLKEAQKIADLLPPLIKEDQSLDVISGTAGCLVALVNLNRVTPADRLVKLATQCGDHLLEKAHHEDVGIGWYITGMDATQPLAGFSHGNSGFAWSLLELAALTGESRFYQAAKQAILYERSVFVPEEGNWPDFRIFEYDHHKAQQEQMHNFMIAWCHGAPGVGLGRLRALELLPPAESLYNEIDTAIQTTIQYGFGQNHSLCHGDLGNIDFLVEASKYRPFTYLKKEIPFIANAILSGIDSHGFLTGIPLGVETPGLMTGLAGIGYELLRLVAPEQVPSVLTLSIPRSK